MPVPSPTDNDPQWLYRALDAIIAVGAGIGAAFWRTADTNNRVSVLETQQEHTENGIDRLDMATRALNEQNRELHDHFTREMTMLRERFAGLPTALQIERSTDRIINEIRSGVRHQDD